MPREYKYDVCLSFAGEQRDYVQQVAHALEADGLRVFYDRFEIVNAWGKDLGPHLDEVFRLHARFCVAFLSEAYASKQWPRHELKSAQTRAAATEGEYLLPARFDDTRIEGVPETVGYVDVRAMNATEFAALITAKVRGKTARETVRPSPLPPPDSPAPDAEPELLIGLVRDRRGLLHVSGITPPADCARCGRTLSPAEPIARFGDGYAHWFDCLDDG